ncbi:OLC1v1000205C1 [Oldenlandia corymbosa var. corymbosa]|uniref:OLC1v1000205C1 n=1 Tax=Oldenlandia corymbosa var. corymbosa TaxID=529605 RepID=A0AAV1D3A6_OLDCO|nr:OLC1v1000205C1 [Oldenlandia corymbosa var. corymbosa]
MDSKEDDLSLSIYKPSNFTGGCLEIRFFNVRIAPCAVDSVPESLTLRHLRREIGVSLEINGNRVPSSETASISLRRDRVDRDSSEVTYVSTDRVRVSGAVEFEVRENETELILCGSLERVDEAAWINGNNALENDPKTGWGMDCCTAASMVSGGSAFFQPRLGVSSPTIEVYVAGCCSGKPVILTKTIQISPRKKVPRHVMLDAIPEDEEIGKEQRSPNGLVRQRKFQGLVMSPLEKELCLCLLTQQIHWDCTEIGVTEL